MKTLWEHERELEVLYIKRNAAIKANLTKLAGCYAHDIFMKTAFIDQHYFEKIPLENTEL